MLVRILGELSKLLQALWAGQAMGASGRDFGVDSSGETIRWWRN
jgi:hypothetical protein